jgi:hypothetical protein
MPGQIAKLRFARLPGHDGERFQIFGATATSELTV